VDELSGWTAVIGMDGMDGMDEWSGWTAVIGMDGKGNWDLWIDRLADFTKLF
jgi:subtilisin-like proprotein convertase family protein